MVVFGPHAVTLNLCLSQDSSDKSAAAVTPSRPRYRDINEFVVRAPLATGPITVSDLTPTNSPTSVVDLDAAPSHSASATNVPKPDDVVTPISSPVQATHIPDAAIVPPTPTHSPTSVVESETSAEPSHSASASPVKVDQQPDVAAPLPPVPMLAPAAGIPSITLMSLPPSVVYARKRHVLLSRLTQPAIAQLHAAMVGLSAASGGRIAVATLCSGTDVCMLSLADLECAFPGAGFTQSLACEVCPDKRQFIRTVHGLNHVFVDVTAMGAHQALTWYVLLLVHRHHFQLSTCSLLLL